VPALVLYASDDLIFYEPTVQETIQRIAGARPSVENATLVRPNRHLNAVTQIGQGTEAIEAFLAR
jgi:hypothetical protein